MDGNDAVPAALPQRFPIGVGEFGGRRACSGGVMLVDIGGNVVDSVAKISVAHDDVQRHLKDAVPVEVLGLKARRRVGYHDDSHGYGRSSWTTPASCRPLSISSATAWCASKFQWIPSGLPLPLMMCSATAAFRSTRGTSCSSAHSVSALTVPA